MGCTNVVENYDGVNPNKKVSETVSFSNDTDSMTWTMSNPAVWGTYSENATYTIMAGVNHPTQLPPGL